MQAVTIDRHKFIGGSDTPILMGISPFKTRFELLLEKAQLKDNDFEGNEYTEYGNILEPKIRDFINQTEKDKYIEDKIIQDDLRYHSDGFNGKSVLEIKTTSQIKENVEDYKVYLVQLLFGMQIHGVKKGKLAVYERPKDFNEEFDEERLTIYDIDIKDYKDLLEKINFEIERFRTDLIKVKENPFITEEDLQPKEVIELSNQIIEIENQLQTFKDLETKQKKLKDKLKKAMEEFGIKKWTTPNDTKITLVADGEDKEIEVFNESLLKEQDEKLYEKYTEEQVIKVFNEEKFVEENEELSKKYTETKIKKGRTGYVRISIGEINNE